MLKDLEKMDAQFRYMLLDRMRSDCKYYLSYGNRLPKYLWSGEEKEQIENMKQLFNSFADENKPEWLTMKDIEKFEKEMNGGIPL